MNAHDAVGRGASSHVPVVDEVICQIKAMITSGGLAPGDRLPTERDLSARLGVSRNTVREAVRALALMGVVESRRGAGTFVTSLAPKLLLDSMSLLVELSGSATVVDVLAVRRTLEAEAAAQAAVRITEAQLAELRDCLAAMRRDPQRGDGSVEAVTHADMRFHSVIAAASGNPVLAALIDALSDQTLRSRVWRGYADAGVFERAHSEHEAIWIALRDRDPVRAAACTAAHIAQVEQFLRDRASDPETGLAGPIS